MMSQKENRSNGISSATAMRSRWNTRGSSGGGRFNGTAIDNTVGNSNNDDARNAENKNDMVLSRRLAEQRRRNEFRRAQRYEQVSRQRQSYESESSKRGGVKVGGDGDGGGRGPNDDQHSMMNTENRQQMYSGDQRNNFNSQLPYYAGEYQRNYNDDDIVVDDDTVVTDRQTGMNNNDPVSYGESISSHNRVKATMSDSELVDAMFRQTALNVNGGFSADNGARCRRVKEVSFDELDRSNNSSIGGGGIGGGGTCGNAGDIVRNFPVTDGVSHNSEFRMSTASAMAPIIGGSMGSSQYTVISRVPYKKVFGNRRRGMNSNGSLEDDLDGSSDMSDDSGDGGGSGGIVGDGDIWDDESNARRRLRRRKNQCCRCTGCACSCHMDVSLALSDMEQRPIDSYVAYLFDYELFAVPQNNMKFELLIDYLQAEHIFERSYVVSLNSDTQRDNYCWSSAFRNNGIGGGGGGSGISGSNSLGSRALVHINDRYDGIVNDQQINNTTESGAVISQLERSPGDPAVLRYKPSIVESVDDTRIDVRRRFRGLIVQGSRHDWFTIRAALHFPSILIYVRLARSRNNLAADHTIVVDLTSKHFMSSNGSYGLKIARILAYTRARYFGVEHFDFAPLIERSKARTLQRTVRAVGRCSSD